MQKFIENTILIIAVIILSTFMITSIEKADSYIDIEPISKEEKTALYQQYLNCVEGRE